jgi:hypothetical protein
MYGILFDQTYINMVIFGLIVFFIMFLWRKITVMEGNMFILEKRVDMMKKSDRKDSINKNFESADIVMNEIFKDSTVKNNYCNDINYKCPIDTKIQKNKINTIDLSDIVKNSDMIDYIITEIVSEPTAEPRTEHQEAVDLDVKQEIDQLSKYILEETTNETNVPVSNQFDISNVIDNEHVDIDSVSVSSDITFGNDIDKTMTKKYKNMNVERLREECKEKSLNTEGTKAILISRILEYNKKQK